eukprot:PhM_4_TR10379/c0_g1_i1/m.84005
MRALAFGDAGHGLVDLGGLVEEGLLRGVVHGTVAILKPLPHGERHGLDALLLCVVHKVGLVLVQIVGVDRNDEALEVVLGGSGGALLILTGGDGLDDLTRGLELTAAHGLGVSVGDLVRHVGDATLQLDTVDVLVLGGVVLGLRGLGRCLVCLCRVVVRCAFVGLRCRVGSLRRGVVAVHRGGLVHGDLHALRHVHVLVVLDLDVGDIDEAVLRKAHFNANGVRVVLMLFGLVEAEGREGLRDVENLDDGVDVAANDAKRDVKVRRAVDGDGLAAGHGRLREERAVRREGGGNVGVWLGREDEGDIAGVRLLHGEATHHERARNASGVERRAEGSGLVTVECAVDTAAQVLCEVRLQAGHARATAVDLKGVQVGGRQTGALDGLLGQLRGTIEQRAAPLLELLALDNGGKVCVLGDAFDAHGCVLVRTEHLTELVGRAQEHDRGLLVVLRLHGEDVDAGLGLELAGELTGNACIKAASTEEGIGGNVAGRQGPHAVGLARALLGGADRVHADLSARCAHVVDDDVDGTVLETAVLHGVLKGNGGRGVDHADDVDTAELPCVDKCLALAHVKE